MRPSLMFFSLLIVSILILSSPARPKEKERPNSYGDISLTSRYFRIAAGVWVTSGGLGKERSVRAEKDYVEKWRADALPLVEQKKAELEKQLKTMRADLNLPLVKYSVPLWTISEEEITDSRLPPHVTAPFGYIVRFEVSDLPGSCAVEMVFSSLPPQKTRRRLIERLEKFWEGKTTTRENWPAAVKADEIDRPGIFGDYSPKTTPDTVEDYLVNVENSEKYRQELKRLPPLPAMSELFAFTMADLNNLKAILALFDEYEPAARRKPGRYVEGNMLLGARPKEYRPSGEELVLAEIGSRIKKITRRTPAEELRKYLDREDISREKIEYSSFVFSHADVMGSGRFFYASDPIKEIIWFPQEIENKTQYLVPPPLPEEIEQGKRINEKAGREYTARLADEERKMAKEEILRIVEAAKKKQKSGQNPRLVYREALEQLEALQARIDRGWKGHGPDVLTFGKEELAKAFPGAPGGRK